MYGIMSIVFSGELEFLMDLSRIYTTFEEKAGLL